ncbi:MAG: phosphotransferase [Proteobacteria bacterium]|nr:phosphotransferase [Pseudomonadota bacterium]
MTLTLNEQQARSFLAANKISDCEIKKVAGDASFRSYYRIFSGEKTYILMFAPPAYEDVKPFMKIDEFLVSRNFFAPKIFAADIDSGFLLLEDLGDETYSRVLAKDPSQEMKIYQQACDVLLDLHKASIPAEVEEYNHALLFREVLLFVDWYLPLQKRFLSLEKKAQFKLSWFKIFDLLSKEKRVLVLRDFHADNLMTIPRGVGLLDFQDAVIGSNAYDLVSLLEDARRDVDEKTRQKIIEYYLDKSGCDRENFLRDYSILSLQRNIKILGIFSRLSVRDKKHNYLSLIPRVLDFVESRLNDEIFFEIKKLIKDE